MQSCPTLRLLRKKIVHCRQLLVRCFQLVHMMSEMSRPAQSFGIPGDMLARHAQSGVFSIEFIKFMHMIAQHAMDLADLRCRRT